MPTPFVTTTFAVLTMLNTAGQLAPVDKALIPASAGVSGPIQFNAEACALLRGKMENPEKYVCQIFTSPGEINLTWQPAGFMKDAEKAQPEKKTELKPPPESTPKADPVGNTSVEPPKEAPKPKRVAQQQPRYQRQAMFEGNPLAMLFNNW